MATCIKWPDAYDSLNDTNCMYIYNPKAGDELVFGWTFIKEAATNSDMLIIDNNGTTLYSHHININDSTHPDAEYFTYTFTNSCDYVIIGTNCDKPMYCTEFMYNAVSTNNDLSDVIATRQQIQGALDNKVNTWDIVQSDWNQTGTSEPDYIKNKPSIPDDSNLVHKTGNETIAGNKSFSGDVQINGGKLSVLGSMKLNITQSANTDKPGFTVYNTTSNECGSLQFRPNTIDSKPLLYLGHYNSVNTLDQTYIGFRNYTGARNSHGAASYNLVCPLPEVIRENGTWGSTVGNNNYYTFYMPLVFMNSSKSTIPVLAASDGTVDIANLLPTIPNNIVTANQTLSIAVVSSMPASPDADTLYLVTGA